MESYDQKVKDVNTYIKNSDSELTNSWAANASFQQCALCPPDSSQHAIFQCERFTTPREKIEQLKN